MSLRLVLFPSALTYRLPLVSSTALGGLSSQIARALCLFTAAYCLLHVIVQNNRLVLEGANGSESVHFLPESELPRSFTRQASMDSQGSTPTASQQSARAPGVPASSGAQLTASVDPAAVEQLMSMGFSRERVTEALQVCNGNVEQASNMLVQG